MPKRCLPAMPAHRDPQMRDRLVVMHQNLVRYLAGKFVNRGEPLEDLIQVGTIGLINAIDRFDAGRGTKFSTYATPTIVGEIRRYFRDKAWSLKVPRRLQELNQTASKAQEASQQQTGPPADHSGSRPADRRDRRRNPGSHRTGQCLRHGLARQQDDARFRQRPALAGGVCRRGRRVTAKSGSLMAIWTTLWKSLEPRERAIIIHRFFKDMSQAEVAKQLNISQMHVSRLQNRALSQLKRLMVSDV